MDQNEQPTIESVNIDTSARKNPWKYLSGFLLILLILLSVLYFNQISQTPIEPVNTPPSASPYPTTSPLSTPPTEGQQTFIDSRLEGMKFSYDASKWELIQFSGDNKELSKELNYEGPGVLLRDKQSEDKIVLRYTLPYGTDGWVTLVTADRLKRLEGNLVRIKNRDKNSYQYGLANSLIFFTSAPDRYNELATFCAEEKEKPSQQYRVLDKVGCEEIETRKAIGLINGPTLGYSIHFKNTVDFTQFDSFWTEGNTKDLFEKDKYVVVAILYEGSNPEQGDEIIQQIVN
jgi:hypothetical protein